MAQTRTTSGRGRRVGRWGALAFCAAMVAAIGTGPAPAVAQGLFGGGGGDDRQAAEQTVRVNQLEGQMRSLNGQIEQLSFQIKQLQDQIVRMQKDYEFRLQEIEGGGAKASAKPPLKKSDAGDAPASALAAAPAVVAAAPVASVTPPTAVTPSSSRGAPPADLGQLPASADPIGGLIGATAPMELGAPGVRSTASMPEAAPEPTPVPGVDPRYANVAPTTSPRDEYDAAYGYILNGEYDLAEQSFKSFLANHPTDKRIGAAQFWLGESYYARSRNKEAADAFLKSYTQFPDGPKAPDSLLKLGLALNGLGEKKAACASWDELITKFPKASKAVRDRAAAEKARGKC